MGYLLEELRNPETLEEMRKDVESADIFIGSLIFIQVRGRESGWRGLGLGGDGSGGGTGRGGLMDPQHTNDSYKQELAEKVVEVVKPLRDNLSACLIFPSMPEVMRLNKVRRRREKTRRRGCIHAYMPERGTGRVTDWPEAP